MDRSYEAFLIEDDGVFPNNDRLAVIVYQQVFVAEPGVSPDLIEAHFLAHRWGNSWRDGIYSRHHYHSRAHEALGIASGWVKVQLGGPGGKMVVAGAGDVLVIPAGVSHKNVDQSADLLVIGAYPFGQQPDMRYGEKGDRPAADETIRRVVLPERDPVFGTNGPVMELWAGKK